MKTGPIVHCSTAHKFRREVKKKTTPKVKHHNFFTERHVELQFIPPLRKVIQRLIQGKIIIAIGSHFSKLM